MFCRWRSRVVSICIACVLLAVCPAIYSEETPTAAEAAPAAGTRYALLIGCSDYINVKAQKLIGPPNDVALMKQLLTKRFEFKDDNIRAMTEDSPKAMRPRFANIAQQFERLAKDAKPGDWVFILLSGHGSQQPVDPATSDAGNFEVDGLDEVFLPADVSVSDDKTHFVNAVTDNQLRAWLRAIQDKQARIFLVVDACHSGSMVRGVGNETVREVKAEDVFAPAVIERAQTAAAARASQSPAAKPVPFRLAPDEPNLVAIYAAQATEPTIELDLPLPNMLGMKARDAKRYGLLTFTINQVVTSAKAPLTYTELVQRVRSYYAGIGLGFPTPMIEGKHRDQFLFSDERPVERPSILLQRDATGVWAVNAGELQGLAEGSILAAYPLAGKRHGDKPVGYMKVVNGGLSLDAATVAPCEFAGMPPSTKLVKGMRCAIAQVQCSVQPCRVAVDDRIGLETLTPGDASDADALAKLRARSKAWQARAPWFNQWKARPTPIAWCDG